MRLRKGNSVPAKYGLSPSSLKTFHFLHSSPFRNETRAFPSLEKLVRLCLEERLSPTSLAANLGKPLDGNVISLINILDLSGFLSRDSSFKFDGSPSKLSLLRAKDNYLRFYLKYIEPNKQRILRGGKQFESLGRLGGVLSTVLPMAVAVAALAIAMKGCGCSVVSPSKHLAAPPST